nr:MAG TPA: Preprotein translocase subunit SecB [Caudoviricetes sp.]
MTDFGFDITKVVVDESKIMALSIVANTNVEEREDGKYGLTTNFSASPTRADNGSVFLDLSVEVLSNGAPTYDVQIKTRTMFLFPEGSNEESENEYLRTIGASRAFDYARNYIKMVTVFGPWDDLSLPGIPAMSSN